MLLTRHKGKAFPQFQQETLEMIDQGTLNGALVMPYLLRKPKSELLICPPFYPYEGRRIKAFHL